MDNFIFKINRGGVGGGGGGRGRCTEHNFTFVVSYYTLRCNMQSLNVFILSPLHEHGHPGTWSPLELGPNIFGDPNYNVVFLLAQKVLPVCWGFN